MSSWTQDQPEQFCWIDFGSGRIKIRSYDFDDYTLTYVDENYDVFSEVVSEINILNGGGCRDCE